MTLWLDYMQDKLRSQHSVVGELRVLSDLYSPQLDNKRDITVLLPTLYAHYPDKHYPVIYMHDGQNLFDAATSFAGEWQVDETMLALVEEDIEAIVVGIPNVGSVRMNEYNPFDHPMFGEGRGDAYLQYLMETVKPVIDQTFRTLPDRDNTTIMGSSMGGLISLYAVFRYPQVFSNAGVMSPALWVARDRIYDFVQSASAESGRVYVDVGTRELPSRFDFLPYSKSRRYCGGVRRMVDILRVKGYVDGGQGNKRLMYVEDEGAQHNEAAWARRLPDALRFLLGE